MNVLADVLVDDKELKQALMQDAGERIKWVGGCCLVELSPTYCSKACDKLPGWEAHIMLWTECRGQHTL